MKSRIVFFGTPEFAVPALTALYDAGFEITAVVTQPDKPVGRGLKMEASAVKVKAEELGLTVLQPAALKSGYTEDRPPGSRRTVLTELQSLKPDLGIAVAYGKIIPREALNVFPRGILNIHPSLLPKYRGPSPIQAAILNGDRETGVTIMLLDEEMDHGAILAQAKIAMTPNDTGNSLNSALAQTGAKLLIDTLPKYLAGGIAPRPQDHARATYTKLLTREDGRINWNKPAEYIERMVRAYDMWPGTWTLWERRRLKILRASVLHPTAIRASNSTPGYVFTPENVPSPNPPHKGRGSSALLLPLDGGGQVGVERQIPIAVNCSPGSLLIQELQFEGKKPLSASEFLRGYQKFLGSTLK